MDRPLKRCGRPGCRRTHTNSGSYCHPCHAEYQRAYRASHPRTPEQIAKDRERNRRNKQQAKARRLEQDRRTAVERQAVEDTMHEQEVEIPVTAEPGRYSVKRLLQWWKD